MTFFPLLSVTLQRLWCTRSLDEAPSIFKIEKFWRYLAHEKGDLSVMQNNSELQEKWNLIFLTPTFLYFWIYLPSVTDTWCACARTCKKHKFHFSCNSLMHHVTFTILWLQSMNFGTIIISSEVSALHPDFLHILVCALTHVLAWSMSVTTYGSLTWISDTIFLLTDSVFMRIESKSQHKTHFHYKSPDTETEKKIKKCKKL